MGVARSHSKKTRAKQRKDRVESSVTVAERRPTITPPPSVYSQNHHLATRHSHSDAHAVYAVSSPPVSPPPSYPPPAYLAPSSSHPSSPPSYPPPPESGSVRRAVSTQNLSTRSQPPPVPFRSRQESTPSSVAQTRPRLDIPESELAEDDIPTQVRAASPPLSQPPPGPRRLGRSQNSVSTIPPSRRSVALPLPDPAALASPRPFPFDPPTHLQGASAHVQGTTSARYATLPAQRFDQPWLKTRIEWSRGLTPLRLGVLVLVLGACAGLTLRAWVNGGDEPQSAAANDADVPETPLREFDVDQPSMGERTLGASSSSTTLQAAKSSPALTTQARSAVGAALSSAGQQPKVTVPSDAQLLERAFDGEDVALLQIELKTSRERTFNDLIALAEGREVLARRDAKALAKRFIKMDPNAPDHKLIDALLQAAGDRYAYREAQLGLAQHKSSLGPDLLFKVAQLHRHDETVAEFAQMLLASESVYRRATPALQVAIDGWSTHDCQAARRLLSRAKRIADSRAVFSLAKFARTSGCGNDQSEDCFPCLREDGLLVDALKSAQRHSP